jgi:hypothetical protein
MMAAANCCVGRTHVDQTAQEPALVEAALLRGGTACRRQQAINSVSALNTKRGGSL